MTERELIQPHDEKRYQRRNDDGSSATATTSKNR